MKSLISLLIVASLIPFPSEAVDSKESIAKQVGVEKSVIDSVESSFDISIKQVCNTDTETCNILNNHCNTNPYPNICIMKAMYHSAIRGKLCVSEQSCVMKQSRSEAKYINFVKKHAQEPGYGRLAINVCAPLHEFESSNSNIRNIGEELNTLGGIGIYYDYESLFECVGETYKQAALKGLQ
jgi:hypothetical protein